MSYSESVGDDLLLLSKGFDFIVLCGIVSVKVRYVSVSVERRSRHVRYGLLIERVIGTLLELLVQKVLYVREGHKSAQKRKRYFESRLT